VSPHIPSGSIIYCEFANSFISSETTGLSKILCSLFW